MDLMEQIARSVAAIRQQSKLVPDIAIVLGTGLGALAREIDVTARLDYSRIPGFVRSTVVSHKGELLLGTLCGKNVVAMEGRVHYYEGYTLQDVTFPIRVMKALGAGTLIVSNASGGLNPGYAIGDLMIIMDHINLLGDNPLIGPNDDRLGVRFPDMSQPYDPELIRAAEQAAARLKIVIRKGVYASVTGPNLETRAEYRMLRVLGTDAVGMSTVPEVLVAVHGGMRVFGISVITDMGNPEVVKPVSVEEVIAAANAAEPRLTAVIKEVIRST